MKINEVITTDPQQQHVDAMKKVADNAKKQAKVAAANMKIKKAKEQIAQTQRAD